MKTRLLSIAFMLGVVAVGPASAQAPAPRDPSKVEAGTYAVDPNHTQVGFTVSHMGFTNYMGIFSGASGELTLALKAAGTSTLKVSVPVKSVMTTSAKLDEELKSPQWLDAAKFPDMTFVSTKVVPDGKDKAKVTGDLTLHGVTKPIVLAVTFIGAGTNPMSKKFTVGFEAKGEVKRSDFGINTYVPMIGDTLHLTIAGAFEHK